MMNPKRTPLLRPSEKSGRPTKSTRSVSKQSRYEVLKDKIRTWWEDRLKIGEALREIQTDRLYKHQYETFEEFCEEEFDLKRAQAYRLIEAAKTLESLSPIGDKKINKNIGDSQNPQQIEGAPITNEFQARALASVPEENRLKVIEEVAAKGPVTAKAITEAAQDVVKPEPAKAAKEETHLDKTGYPIPNAILADWQRAAEYKSSLRSLHTIKLDVEKRLNESDLIFREIGKDTLIELQNAWTNLKSVLPYAVCPSCQGRNRKNCTSCKGRGWVSEFAYKNWFAKEVIELREKAIKK